MCIRDSYYASPEVWRDEPYNDKSDIWSFGCIIYEMCSLRPVSYTHLRAHETVLDLVCRLLLEKKNTKNYYIGLRHLI